MTNLPSLLPVSFRDSTLYLVEADNGQPLVPMKPVVEGMGLDWSSQHRKLADPVNRWDTCMVVTTMQMPGDDQHRQVACLPLRKLPGWMMTIQPSRCRPEIRETVIAYQNECDDVLWDYWSNARPQPEPPQPTSQLPLFLTKEELTAEFREVIRNGIHQAFRGAARGLIRVEVNNAMLDQREWMIEDIQQAVTAGINATFKTPAEAHFDQRAAEATEAAAKARTKAGKPDPVPPGRLDEGRHAEQRAQARERHHQDLRIEAVSGGTWKDYLRRHNIGRLFTTEERQAMKAEFYQLQHACKPLAA
ncbi:phage antirepressor N-terminal domain-containing protein [Lamprobacter modestohalophilus]|uniref:phage antirepressor N-terminal domain-containing protein n=1 Tax=Lamprobacter modestohalophilus TaxID=1064514 RepID=UPI002ADEEA33|nr:phage antirepressor N-terminal domain-containing protein [Lamprobacter modestohalophilus]MEA1050514.1 phage antirepressor N-terminal domain-containing protein [Lamprobacter modestohalophilus]